MLTKVKKAVRSVQSVVERIASPSTSKAYYTAKKLGLFDPKWYQEHYGTFPYEYAAFKDYLAKSTFCNVNPSQKFDTEYYLRRSIDLYLAGKNPLIHFMYHGRFEGRHTSAAQTKWVPRDELLPEDVNNWKHQKIAVVLHIYYEDFISKFASCLESFPSEVDIFITAGSEDIAKKAKDTFSGLATVNTTKVHVAENRGRNFGPFLINFGPELLGYDLMCHMHSKKSLYSGREQTQWFDYLNQYLLKDKHVTKSILRLFKANPELGMYYPTSFWMMPSWVNHWTCNKPHASSFVNDWNIDISDNFVNYPVGGMFWARPKAIEQLLSQRYTYEDFPAEPLPNDGTFLHAMERVLGILAEKNGFDQFFYYPPLGRFTKDKTYISTSYYKQPHQLYEELAGNEIISFDIFDTVLRRKYCEPDYAKFLLGEELVIEGKFESKEIFVEQRNSCELACRQKQSFKNDVSIFQVYDQMAEKLSFDKLETRLWAQREFELDLDMTLPKDEIVTIVHQLYAAGKQLWFISDTYYTEEQIALMLKHIGISIPYKLFVSSHLNKRKDTGAMWSHVKALVDQLGMQYVHVGDSVRSDAQICGDFGLQTMHILHPEDKWQIAGMPKGELNANKRNSILKWGRLKSNFGRYPFFGE